jgi:hypothetical protein
MQDICELEAVNSLNEVRRLAEGMVRWRIPYACRDDVEFDREMFVMRASKRCSEDEASQIFDEAHHRTLARRRMEFDLSRPAADRANLSSIKPLCGDVTASWATWAIVSPWWPGELVTVRTPELFDPQVIAFRVVEATGLSMPIGAFKEFWPQLMASVEVNGACR